MERNGGPVQLTNIRQTNSMLVAPAPDFPSPLKMETGNTGAGSGKGFCGFECCGCGCGCCD